MFYHEMLGKIPVPDLAPSQAFLQWAVLASPVQGWFFFWFTRQKPAPRQWPMVNTSCLDSTSLLPFYKAVLGPAGAQ